ncbi:MAG TPA: cation diffusion facilitator family transporter, partial [Myxococcota bacterium]|nr:cation diffusion facilitator family transporter [Myxococcota bacterium]
MRLRPPTFYAWLSVATSLVTLTLKFSAYYLTGSVGLLSDAVETFVNIFAALVALGVLTYSAMAPDRDHNFGHEKAQYFSSGIEGALIFGAAGAIVWTAIPRLTAPQPLEQVGLGIVLSVAAALANAACAFVMLRAAREHRSITLEADARHLLTDVWTTGGVLVGVVLVQATGWLRLDPIVAIL